MKLSLLMMRLQTSVFSERKPTFMFAICRHKFVCLSVICRLSSVTFVRLTQTIEFFFGNVYTIYAAFSTLAIR